MRASSVFLSHATADKPFVRMVAGDIAASGSDVWIDEVEMRDGDSLIRRISDGLAHANYVLAFLSGASAASTWVREELEIAETRGIQDQRVVVLPALLDDAPLPTFLGHRRCCDFRRPDLYDGAFRDLLTRINQGARSGRAWSFSSLTLDATRKDRLVRVASEPTMQQWVLDYLIGMLDRRSHQERHYMYLALAALGGSAAKRAVKRGLEERDDFARLGAEKAWRLLNRRG